MPRHNQPSAPTRSRRGSSRQGTSRAGRAGRPRIGQHFLVDSLIAGDIVAAAQLTGFENVLEIGPGRGALTNDLLLSAAHVTAIELDEGLAEALRRRHAGSDRLTVISDSILSHTPDVLLAEGGRSPPYVVVANLPYYITAPALRHLLEGGPRPLRMVLMVQREVAESIAGASRSLSLLGVSVQVFGSVEILFRVPREAFAPRPKVDSAVIRILVHPEPLVPESDLDGFFTVVRAGFRNPRKQLHNALGSGLWLPPGMAPELLQAVGIDSARRAATLTIADWSRLQRVYEAARPGFEAAGARRATAIDADQEGQ